MRHTLKNLENKKQLNQELQDKLANQEKCFLKAGADIVNLKNQLETTKTEKNYFQNELTLMTEQCDKQNKILKHQLVGKDEQIKNLGSKIPSDSPQAEEQSPIKSGIGQLVKSHRMKTPPHLKGKSL